MMVRHDIISPRYDRPGSILAHTNSVNLYVRGVGNEAVGYADAKCIDIIGQ